MVRGFVWFFTDEKLLNKLMMKITRCLEGGWDWIAYDALTTAKIK